MTTFNDRDVNSQEYNILQEVGLASLAPTPFIQNGSSAHSQMHALVITHVGYRSAWYGIYDHPLPGTWVLEYYIEHAHLWHPVGAHLLNQSTV